MAVASILSQPVRAPDTKGHHHQRQHHCGHNRPLRVAGQCHEGLNQRSLSIVHSQPLACFITPDGIEPHPEPHHCSVMTAVVLAPCSPVFGAVRVCGQCKGAISSCFVVKEVYSRVLLGSSVHGRQGLS